MVLVYSLVTCNVDMQSSMTNIVTNDEPKCDMTSANNSRARKPYERETERETETVCVPCGSKRE